MFAIRTKLFLYTPVLGLSGAGDSTLCNASRDIMPARLPTVMVKRHHATEDVKARDPLYSPINTD